MHDPGMSNWTAIRAGCTCPCCDQPIRNQRTFGVTSQPLICEHCEAPLREAAPLSFFRPLLAWGMLIGGGITWPLALVTGEFVESAALFAVLPTVVMLLSRLSRYERVTPPARCLTCDYDLRAAAVSRSDACPECGRHIVPDQQALLGALYLPPAAQNR